MKQNNVTLYSVKTDTGKTINYRYVSLRKSRKLNTSEMKRATHGKLISVCFKRRRFCNIFSKDIARVVFILPVKSQLSEGTPFGTYGGRREGIYARRWFELRNGYCYKMYLEKVNSQLHSFLLDKTGSLASLNLKRVRNKKLARYLNYLDKTIQ